MSSYAIKVCIKGKPKFLHGQTNLRLFYLNRLINITVILDQHLYFGPIPVAERSKVWVCGRMMDGIVVSSPAGSMDVFLL
jgi:hypothetical protein